MSKIIRLTPQHIQQYCAEFHNVISTSKLFDGKIAFTKTLSCPNEKATIFFEPIAWRKMQALIEEFNKEVAWHGVVYRGEDETKNEFYIKDILVYPQEVTGATVNTDQSKYEMWLMSHEDDVFFNIRMQGHSHVNMGVSPSSVDEMHQTKILDQLKDDMFYIFLIWNKKGDKTIRIFDLKKNILFETPDVTVTVLDDGMGINEFIENAKSLVKDKQYIPAYPTGYYGGNKNLGGTTHEKDNGYVKTQPNSPQANVSSKQSKYGKHGKRKGKRKKDIVVPVNASTNVSNQQLSIFDNCLNPFYGDDSCL